MSAPPKDEFPSVDENDDAYQEEESHQVELKGLKVANCVSTWQGCLGCFISVLVVMGLFVFYLIGNFPCLTFNFSDFKVINSEIASNWYARQLVTDTAYSKLNKSDSTSSRRRMLRKRQQQQRQLLANTIEGITLYDSTDFYYRAIAAVSLNVFYYSKRTNNILTEELLEICHEIELGIKAYDGYSNHSLVYKETDPEITDLVSQITGQPATQIFLEASPGSFLNYIFPQVIVGNYIFNGNGDQLVLQGDIESTLREYSDYGDLTDFFDFSFDFINVSSNYLAAIYPFGYKDEKEKKDELLEWVASYATNYFNKLPPSITNKVGVAVTDSRGTILENELYYYLGEDLKLALISLLAIYIVVYLYCRSFYITTFGLIGVLLAFIPCFAIYEMVWGKSFNLINMVAIWVILGIGCDDICVFMSSYRRAPLESIDGQIIPNHLRLAFAYREAGAAMFVTSFTTSCSFFSLCLSPINPLPQFGWFLGSLVLVNFIMVMSWFPCILQSYVWMVMGCMRCGCHLSCCNKWLAVAVPLPNQYDSKQDSINFDKRESMKVLKRSSSKNPKQLSQDLLADDHENNNGQRTPLFLDPQNRQLSRQGSSKFAVPGSPSTDSIGDRDGVGGTKGHAVQVSAPGQLVRQITRKLEKNTPVGSGGFSAETNFGDCTNLYFILMRRYGLGIVLIILVFGLTCMFAYTATLITLPEETAKLLPATTNYGQVQIAISEMDIDASQYSGYSKATKESTGALGVTGTKSPTRNPVVPSPTRSPTDPTPSPTDRPTQSPSTAIPSTAPTTPSSTPTTDPTNLPTLAPSNHPTLSPVLAPTASPITPDPTLFPTTGSPSKSPTQIPTSPPTTKTPTSPPTTPSPTLHPTTTEPSLQPSSSPSESPTTVQPTPLPTRHPIEPEETSAPTKGPSPAPTKAPTPDTNNPTTAPSSNPSKTPTSSPTTPSPTTSSPTTATPTEPPTSASPTTAEPTTADPTTASPTTAEPTTIEPSRDPTEAPTTREPSTDPTSEPSSSPTRGPSSMPSPSPTTGSPTTAEPTGNPTGDPTSNPTANPTPRPTHEVPVDPTYSCINQDTVSEEVQTGKTLQCTLDTLKQEDGTDTRLEPEQIAFVFEGGGIEGTNGANLLSGCTVYDDASIFYDNTTYISSYPTRWCFDDAVSTSAAAITRLDFDIKAPFAIPNPSWFRLSLWLYYENQWNQIINDKGNAWYNYSIVAGYEAAAETLSVDESVSVYILFGTNGVSEFTTNCDGEIQSGELSYDRKFNIYDIEAQQRWLELCEALNNIDDPIMYRTDEDQAYCFAYYFDKWLNETHQERVGAITTQQAFNAYISEFVAKKSYYYAGENIEPDSFDDWFGTETTSEWFNHNASIRWMYQQIHTQMNSKWGGSKMYEYYVKWEEFIQDFNEKSSSSFKGVQTSSGYIRMEVEVAFLEGFVQSVLYTIILCAVVMIFFTQNIFLVFLVCLYILIICIWVVGIFGAVGWPFGIIEIISVPTVVGLTIDYALHITHAYIHSPFPDRLRRAKSAVNDLGSSIFASAMTTIGSMLILYFATIVIFSDLGWVVGSTTCFGVALALFVCPPCLMYTGPEYDQCHFTWCCPKHINGVKIGNHTFCSNEWHGKERKKFVEYVPDKNNKNDGNVELELQNMVNAGGGGGGEEGTNAPVTGRSAPSAPVIHNDDEEDDDDVEYEEEILPNGWRAVLTDDGKVYYQNDITKQTQWKKPMDEQAAEKEQEKEEKENVYIIQATESDKTGIDTPLVADNKGGGDVADAGYPIIQPIESEPQPQKDEEEEPVPPAPAPPTYEEIQVNEELMKKQMIGTPGNDDLVLDNDDGDNEMELEQSISLEIDVMEHEEHFNV